MVCLANHLKLQLLRLAVNPFLFLSHPMGAVQPLRVDCFSLNGVAVAGRLNLFTCPQLPLLIKRLE
jgi:hypothetical protein